MPQRKKDDSVRARRNKAATRATLQPRLSSVGDFDAMTLAELREELAERGLPVSGNKAALRERLLGAMLDIPLLPERPQGWHQMTQTYWADIWTSPMEGQWDDSDFHNVLIVTMLYDDAMRAETAKDRKEAFAELRQQRMSLGLSPYDRRRLEWTIETAEEAKDKGQRRRSSGPKPQTQEAPAKAADPRAGLSVVS